MTTYVGIDPGASGAMCLLFEDGTIEFYDFKKGGIRSYATILGAKTDIIAVELVHSFSNQGVKSMFSFGQRLGELHGMLQTLDLPYVEVRPQAWQKACGVVPKSGKKGIHATISVLYPDASLVGPRGGLIDGRCDALGIAHYLKEINE